MAEGGTGDYFFIRYVLVIIFVIFGLFCIITAAAAAATAFGSCLTGVFFWRLLMIWPRP